MHGFRNYIFEKEFRIIYLENKLDILNYSCIDHFSDEKMIIRYNEGSLIIKGKNLVIAKMLDDEMLISGFIKAIEFNDWNFKKQNIYKYSR